VFHKLSLVGAGIVVKTPRLWRIREFQFPNEQKFSIVGQTFKFAIKSVNRKASRLLRDPPLAEKPYPTKNLFLWQSGPLT